MPKLKITTGKVSGHSLSFSNGRSFYEKGRGNYAVDEGSYLQLNKGQEHSITIESKVPVESFCIFFPDGFAEEVYRTLITPADQRLDNPFEQPPTIDFVERTYPHDNLLTSVIFLRIGYLNKKDDWVWLDEQLHDIIQRFLHVHRQVLREMASFPALRSSYSGSALSSRFRHMYNHSE